MRARFLIIACVLLITFFAGPARTEDRTPVPTTPEPAASTEKADQKQGELIMPAGQGTLPAPEKENENDIQVQPAKGPVPAKAAVATETNKYVIKQNDTLWDISNGFYKDPFLWPLIWKANPSITNPDLIYPGTRLVIPSLAPIERAIQRPVEKAQPVENESEDIFAYQPSMKPKPVPTPTTEPTSSRPKLVLPDELPVPIIDKYAMLSAGFLSQDETDDKIVGSREPKTIFAYDDIVFIQVNSRDTVNIGDRFLIYKLLTKVKHPMTGSTYGRLVRGLGVLQVISKDRPDMITARIVLSFDAIEKGNLITPYQEPSLVYEPSKRRKKDISGYILEVVDGRTINAQMDIVYLDKGAADGIEPGDRLKVFGEPENSNHPLRLIGEVQVFIVKDGTSTAVVRKSSDTLTKGDMIASELAGSPTAEPAVQEQHVIDPTTKPVAEPISQQSSEQPR